MEMWPLVLKLDISKAFDSLHRGKFLHRLSEKLGNCEELRSWWNLFQHTEAGLSTAWGESSFPLLSGVRQGSVESPQAFASAMDWILADVVAKHHWDPCNDVLAGLQFAETAFMDDCILWDGSKLSLSARAGQFIADEWGLRVNPEKSQVYHSPFSTESSTLRVGDQDVAPDDRLDVMGIPFASGVTPKEAMQGIFARTKSNKHLFRAKTPLSGRLRLMHRVLGGTALWCAGAFLPDKHALHAVNALLSQLVCWAMRLSKGAEEPWVEYKVRCLRSARNAIHLHMRDRWSTLWLRRSWD